MPTTGGGHAEHSEAYGGCTDATVPVGEEAHAESGLTLIRNQPAFPHAPIWGTVL